MRRASPFQFFSAFVFHLEQQRHRPFADKGGDEPVHLCRRGRCLPSEPVGHSVESPQPCIVALCSDDRLRPYHRSSTHCKLIAAAYMTGQHGYGKASGAVYIHHSRVCVLVVHAGRYVSHTDAERTYEYERIEIGKPVGKQLFVRLRLLASVILRFAVDSDVRQLFFQLQRYIKSSLRNKDYGCFPGIYHKKIVFECVFCLSSQQK